MLHVCPSSAGETDRSAKWKPRIVDSAKRSCLKSKVQSSRRKLQIFASDLNVCIQGWAHLHTHAYPMPAVFHAWRCLFTNNLVTRIATVQVGKIAQWLQSLPCYLWMQGTQVSASGHGGLILIQSQKVEIGCFDWQALTQRIRWFPLLTSGLYMHINMCKMCPSTQINHTHTHMHIIYTHEKWKKKEKIKKNFNFHQN